MNFLMNGTRPANISGTTVSMKLVAWVQTFHRKSSVPPQCGLVGRKCCLVELLDSE